MWGGSNYINVHDDQYFKAQMYIPYKNVQKCTKMYKKFFPHLEVSWMVLIAVRRFTMISTSHREFFFNAKVLSVCQLDK